MGSSVAMTDGHRRFFFTGNAMTSSSSAVKIMQSQQQLKLAERFGDVVVTGSIDALIFVHLAHGGYPLGWQVRTVLCAAMKPEQLLGAGCTKEDEHRRK